MHAYWVLMRLMPDTRNTLDKYEIQGKCFDLSHFPNKRLIYPSSNQGGGCNPIIFFSSGRSKR